jgi:HAE1 family hydrophobic/amphiphilic exporter-1
MTLSDLSIRRPVFAWMLMTSLIIFGAISFLRLGISQLPDVDFPVLSISLTYEGAAPEIMETDVVDVVENAVSTVEGIRQVSSVSRTGSATVTVELELNRNIDSALQEVQAKIAEAQRRLPRDMEPPTIRKTNPDDQPILWIAVESDRHSLRDLMAYVRDVLQPAFTTTENVGDVNLGGYIDPNLRVWVDAASLAKYQLTIGDVIDTIRLEHVELPSGYISTPHKEYNVRTLGEAKSIAEFERLLIKTRGGAPNFLPIELRSVATVEDGLADVRRLSRAMGRPAVGLGIKKQRGANAVAVANAVKKKLEQMRETLPAGMTLTVNFDSTRYIEEAVGELLFTMGLSALLTALVCWMFLGSWSSTFNVLLSIPTSIIGTFTVMYFAGFTLNTFTLLGLSLAIGIVVDDAIMVLENIIRQRERGRSRVEAAIVGAREITFAALVATLSIVAIFLPVAFMEGIIGKYFFQFGVVMTAAVLLSLVEALTLTPMRCASFVDIGERRTRCGRAFEAAFRGLEAGYRKLLVPTLRWRVPVVLASTALFGASLVVVKALNKEFVPAEDQGRFMLRLQTPVGSSLPFTDEKVKLVEAFLKKRREVSRFFGAIGGFGGSEVNTAILFVTMRDKGARGISPELGREPTQEDFMGITRKTLGNIPDLRVTVQDLSARGFSASRGFPVEFAIQGPDWERLGELATQVGDALEKTGLVTDVDNDYRLGMPEIQVIPNRAAAAARGVSIASIGETVHALIGGVVVGKYESGGHRYDIRVKLREAEGLGRIERIRDLYVRNNRGELVRMGDIVTVREKPTLLSIHRRNRERAVSVFANVAPGQSQQAALDAAMRLGKTMLPDGYRLVLSGGSKAFQQAFGGLVFALVLGIVIAYMVLASQFNSFVHPFSVLVALPFSVSGALVALWLTNTSLNVYSMIGLILLMGIVKKNSILLVDFTNLARANGLDSDGQPSSQPGGRPVTGVDEALLIACPLRLRPVLMTSFATIVGALPPALAIGPGAESRVPMAITVIGGSVVSTLLTLFVVPCVYRLLLRWESKKAKDPAILALEAQAAGGSFGPWSVPARGPS